MCRFRLSLILLLFAPAAFAVQDCELNGESVNPANGNTTKGKTGMMRCHDRDTGKLARERELRAGKFVGLERFYNRDGKAEREHQVNEKGNRDGLAREFFPDGRVAHEETYRNGAGIGVARHWYENGTLKRVVSRGDDGGELVSAEFNDRGQLRELHCADRPVRVKEIDDKAWCGHGVAKPVVRELYSDDGVVVGRVAHQAGKMTLSEWFWDNGKLREQREMGVHTSFERRYSREGVKRYEASWTKTEHGRVKEWEREFHDSGTLVLERRWQGGELASEKTWYLNSQPKTDYQYSMRDGRLLCEATVYRDNGKRADTGTYLVRYGSFDKPVGSVRSYDKEGRLKMEREFDVEGHPTREREFDEGGGIKRDDAVFEDGSRKAYVAPAR